MQTNHTHLQSQRKIPKIYYFDILTKLSSLSHQKSDEVENIMGVKIIITYIVNLRHFEYGCFRLDPRSGNEITMNFGGKLLQMHMSPSIFMIMEGEESDLEVNKTDNTTTGAEYLAKLREHTMHRFGAIYYTTLIHTNTTNILQTNK